MPTPGDEIRCDSARQAALLAPNASIGIQRLLALT